MMAGIVQGDIYAYSSGSAKLSLEVEISLKEVESVSNSGKVSGAQRVTAKKANSGSWTRILNLF